MNKTGLIFRHEFTHAIRRIGFIIMMFVVPAAALLGIGIVKLVTTVSQPAEQSIKTVGYVDEVGIFESQTSPGFARMVPFASKDEATAALARKEVSEFIVIPSDYMNSGVIHRYTLEKELGTPAITSAVIKIFLTGNLLKDKVPPDIVALINSPLKLEVTRITEQGDLAQEQGNIGNLVVPGIFSLLLALALMSGATNLISGLGEEKESRLIEVLFSSVSVRQLLIGKVLALGAAGLLQVLVWLISAPLILRLASSTFGGFMNDLQLPVNFLVLGIVYFILGYLLFAVLSISIGAISATAREGGQLSMFYTMTSFIPLWFLSLLMFFPNSPVWVALTIFPVTAPIQTMVRLGESDVPMWPLLTSIAVLALSIVVGLILAIKLFRMHMLMYGKRPGFAEIVRNLKNV